MGTGVTVDSVAGLSDAERAEVAELSRAVYPPGSITGWPGLAVEWDAPGWCVRVREGDSLASYAGLYIRAGELNGQPVLVGGVGNVKTHPDSRGQGLASAALREAAAFLGDRGADFGLLVCEPGLTRFYARLGWRPLRGRLMVRQRGEAAEFTLCPAMTLALASAGLEGGTVDLCGPPW